MTTITITQDDDNTESPRDWDNMGTMIAFHSKYNLGDSDHGFNSRDYNGWDELQDAIEKANPNGEILPLYLYDHSGITMNTTGFSCPWDSAQVGFIVASGAKIRETFGVKRLTKEVRLQALDSLRGEVEAFDQFIRGDVYRFTIEDDEGNITNSCGGFYGNDPMTNGMSDHIPVELHGLLQATAVTY
jgi:hypothetical protein